MKLLLLAIIISTVTLGCSRSPAEQKPNVILILTDDQGFGDLGFHGNHHIHTPALDSFASQSARFTNFYVSPVCAPTRASLMTGRYALRTGVRDTYNGGAIMATEEITIAEMLKEAGYKTGIFGKWHLGDNYPSRPKDQGFDESIIHLSGGMGQVGDFTTWFEYDSSYFNPILWNDGEMKKYNGYCSDIFATQAIEFIENNKNKPFFCYLSFNAPHTPLQVPEEYYERYRTIDPSIGFDDVPMPLMSEKDKEDARKVYGMVTNIDDNLNVLFDKIKELHLDKSTIVIFMTDNGPQQRRYTGGFRKQKGSVYDGGVHVPFYLSYPPLNTAGKSIEITSAHIDVLPTIAELCGVKVPDDRIIDGRSLVDYIKDPKLEDEERSIFMYWTRRYPEKYRNMALLKPPFKIVGNTEYNALPSEFELYNMALDPYELNDVSATLPDKVSSLKAEMVSAVNELLEEPHLIYHPPIHIGTDHENPLYLNRNDAGGERGIWSQDDKYGYWNVLLEEGVYDITIRFIDTVPGGGKMFIEIPPVNYAFDLNASSNEFLIEDVHLNEQAGNLTPFYMVKRQRYFPFWIKLERR